MKKILLFLLALIVAIVLIVLFNTFTMTSKQVTVEAVEMPAMDDSVYIHLAKAIQFKTVSVSEVAPTDSAAFNGYHKYLETTFPLIHENLSFEKINGYSLLYKWQGKNKELKPLILMSHQDVVPVDEPTLSLWQAEPFSGTITDTHILGRGTMDDKGTQVAVLETVEMLIREGFQPSADIYLAFGHDEEIGGANGAAKIADHLKSIGVQAAMAIDEGGFLAENMVDGIDRPMAMINLAEKGYASFKLIVETAGGHSSQPPVNNTIGMLAQAIVDLEDNQLPYKLVDPVTHQLTHIGPEMPFQKKMAFANPWLFKSVILEALNSHTTTAPTIIKSGVKDNVIPTVAEAVINFRILPGETIKTVQSHIEKIVGENVKVEINGFVTNPSPVSSIESAPYKMLEKTIRSVFPNSIVVPGLVGGGTDARYFYAVSDNVYRFYPIRISPENMKGFHGIDEKITKENYKEIIGFTYHLIKNFSGEE